MINKYVNDRDEVAVLYSPGFGAGWSTWNREHPDMLFDAGMVDLVLKEDVVVVNHRVARVRTNVHIANLEEGG